MTQTTHATGKISVHKYEPAVYEQPVSGPVLSRIHVEESFTGDNLGEGADVWLDYRFE